MDAQDVALLVGSAVSLVVLGAVGWGQTRPVRVPTVGRWTRTPVIIPGPGVGETNLDIARATWAGLGHRSVVLHTGPADISIVVDPALVDRGKTVCTVVNGSTITRAEIRVKPGATALELAHELGHAFGYLHPYLCPSGHLMHPRHPGWNARGLERP